MNIAKYSHVLRNVFERYRRVFVLICKYNIVLPAPVRRLSRLRIIGYS